jgi:hypothetical protein
MLDQEEISNMHDRKNQTIDLTPHAFDFNKFYLRFQFFKKTLSEARDLSKKLWETDEYLRKWCVGKLFTIAETNQLKDIRAIEFDDFLSIFHDGLVFKHDYLVNEMWKKNKNLLPAWYGSRPVNITSIGKQSDDMKDIIQLALFEDIIDFYTTVVMPSENQYIIEEMMRNNPYLQLWFCREPIEFAKTNQPSQIKKLSLEEQIEFFLEKVVPCPSLDLIEVMWEKNSDLQSYLLGRPTQFGHNQSEDESRIIAFNDFMTIFEFMLKSRRHFLTKQLWDNSYNLKFWYSRQPTKFTSMYDISSTSLDKLLHGFKLALLSEDPYIIEVIWHASITIRTLLLGHTFNFSMSDRPDYYSLPSLELLDFFEKAITSKACPQFIINEMLESTPLQKIISSQVPSQFKSLAGKLTDRQDPILSQKFLELVLESSPSTGVKRKNPAFDNRENLNSNNNIQSVPLTASEINGPTMFPTWFSLFTPYVCPVPTIIGVVPLLDAKQVSNLPKRKR